MKKISFLILLLVSVFLIKGQTLITSSNYTTLTKFQTVNSSKDEKYNLSLAKLNTTGKHILLVEHIIVDYSKNLMDTAGISIQLDIYKEIKRGTNTWAEMDKVFLFPTANQPATNSTGRVFSFDLPDTLLYDIKNQRIWEFTLINKDTKSKYTTVKSQIGLSDIGKNFFITNSSAIRLKNTKGSFDDISTYKTKLIPLYSLFRKDSSYISKNLGESSEANVAGDILKKIYITQEGKYIITFQDNLASEIEMFPIKKYKYIGKLFIIDKIPFEITNCNCGEYSTRGTGSSGNSITDGIINTFKDKTQHRILFSNKGRFLEKVSVEIY